MGLDGVELIITIEEAFDISIEDKEAALIITSKDIIDLITTKITLINHGCLSQQYFHKLRTFLIKECVLKRSEINLQLNIKNLINKKEEKNLWLKIGETFNIKMPELIRPDWLQALIWLIPFTLSGIILFFYPFYISLVMFFIIFKVADSFTEYKKEIIPPQFSKLRRLAGYLASQHPNNENNTWSKEQIKLKVKHIVIAQLGISNKQYNENLKFIQDYGVD